MTINNLPEYTGQLPSRQDSNSFPARGEAALNYMLITFPPAMNTVIGQINSTSAAVTASAAAASISAANAADSAEAASEAMDLAIANASGTVEAGSAKAWASKAEDAEVLAGQYSALHWAAKAAASVAVLPEGTINDAMVAAEKTWSSEKIFSEILVGRKIEIADKAGAYTIVDTDRSKIIRCSGAFTLTLMAAATLGSGWFFFAHNVGSGNITIDPNGSETIDTQPNVIFEPDNFFLIVCDGTNFKCVRLNKPRSHYINSSQSWTCPAGVYEIDVELWGAGASGGKSDAVNYPGSGGGGGAYSRKKIKTTPGTTYSITIGIGGLSQTYAGSTGNNGGSSSFGSEMTCVGGTAGPPGGFQGAFALYAYATSTGGDINIPGGQGQYYSVVPGSPAGNISVGGNSFGGTETFLQRGDYPPIAGKSHGCGGTGSCSTSDSGAGANGLCIIWY